jgi:hypothetical protein
LGHAPVEAAPGGFKDGLRPPLIPALIPLPYQEELPAKAVIGDENEIHCNAHAEIILIDSQAFAVGQKNEARLDVNENQVEKYQGEIRKFLGQPSLGGRLFGIFDFRQEQETGGKERLGQGIKKEGERFIRRHDILTQEIEPERYSPGEPGIGIKSACPAEGEENDVGREKEVFLPSLTVNE